MRADDILSDGANRADFAGVSVRKGTVAAFLANARIWTEAGADAAERAVAERDILEALPALRATGLFDVLQVRDARLADLIARA